MTNPDDQEGYEPRINITANHLNQLIIVGIAVNTAALAMTVWNWKSALMLIGAALTTLKAARMPNSDQSKGA